MKQRIAICLYGLHPKYCWKGIEPKKDVSYKYFKSNILNQNEDIDIFLHSFSINDKDQLINEYNPLKYLIEKQKDFIINNKFKKKITRDGEFHKKNKKYYNKSFDEILYSLTYGIKKTIELMSEYEKENNFKYHFVMLSRMDVVWLKPILFKNLDNNKFYSSIWGVNNIMSNGNNGVLGYWFISNSELIKKYASLFDKMEEYFNNNIKPSYHFIAKYHIDTFTKNIEYIFNDVSSFHNEQQPVNDIVHHDLQRYLHLYRVPSYVNGIH